jgi:23S rRNA (adenine2030-N6)-methyltransferase
MDKEGQHDDLAALLLPDSGKMPVAVADYIHVLKAYVTKNSYPGSPLVVADLLKSLAEERGQSPDVIEQLNMHLSELHPSAFSELKEWTSKTNFHCHHRSGFELLNAITPPKPKRGLVLIDPPYEQALEYGAVFDVVAKSLAKWKNGIFCIWYPLLSPERIDRVSKQLTYTPKHGLSENMIDDFTVLARENGIGLTDVHFAHQSPSSDVGMYGSGMLILNPPWQLEDSLQDLIEHLESHVKADANELSGVSILVPSL